MKWYAMQTIAPTVVLVWCAVLVVGAAAIDTVLFDIDDTLAPGTLNFFKVIPGAVQAVRSYSDKGYLIVMITRRPRIFRYFTKKWLAKQNFVTNDSDDDDVLLYMPRRFPKNDAATFVYKRDTLVQIRDEMGLDFRYGYGDSGTDFDAFTDAGLDSETLFAVQRRRASDCAPGDYAECLVNYNDHLEFIANQPNATSR